MWWLPILCLFGILVIEISYILQLMGIEYFVTIMKRTIRRVMTGRPDDDDDDPRGIGGGYA